MIPVGDFVKRRTTPYVNWALIIANFAAYVFMIKGHLFSFPPAAVDFAYDWSLIPACLAKQAGIHTGADPNAVADVCVHGNRVFIQPFTAMFLHAGWEHLLANMLFLWIFGDNVEDRLGHLRYLAFYLLCGLSASALETTLTLDSVIPNLGASGAIAGVLAGYLLMYPTAIVEVIILPLFFIPFFIPAVLMIGVWFLMQVFFGISDLGNSTAAGGIAWWAHVGGFMTGAVLIWFLKQPRPEWPSPRTWSTVRRRPDT